VTGNRELVIAAAMPKTLALALGWGLAQGTSRFFNNTHLLHHSEASGRYTPVRVHPSQPTSLGIADLPAPPDTWLPRSCAGPLDSLLGIGNGDTLGAGASSSAWGGASTTRFGDAPARRPGGCAVRILLEKHDADRLPRFRNKIGFLLRQNGGTAWCPFRIAI